jgi:hypothetical protein
LDRLKVGWLESEVSIWAEGDGWATVTGEIYWNQTATPTAPIWSDVGPQVVLVLHFFS